MATKLNLGIEYFNDPETGRPLASGQVYIGQVDLDPAIEANRVTVTLEQEDGSSVSIAPSAQPLTIGAGGRIMYSGSPVAVTVDGAYSIKVLDNLGSQIYYVAASSQPEADPADTGLLVLNGSFENQEVTTGLPDNWTLNIGENGSIEIDSSDQAHGLNSLKFSGTDATGGGTATSSLFDVLKGGSLYVEFTYKSSAVDTLNKVQVKYYNELSVVVSTDTVYSNGATNPASYTTYARRSSVPLTAVQALIIITGIDGAGTTVIGSTNFDRIYAGQDSLNEYDNIGNLRDSNPVDGRLVYSKGHTDIDDGGGGEFIGVTGASPGTYTDDGGVTILPTGGDGSAAWVRQYSGLVNSAMFGANPSLVDSSSQLSQFFNYVAQNNLRGDWLEGVYNASSPIAIALTANSLLGFGIIGRGRGITCLRYTGAGTLSNGLLSVTQSADYLINMELKGFKIDITGSAVDSHALSIGEKVWRSKIDDFYAIRDHIVNDTGAALRIGSSTSTLGNYDIKTSRLYITSFGRGVSGITQVGSFGKVTNLTIDDSYIANCYYSVYLYNAQGVTIRNTQSENARLDGLYTEKCDLVTWDGGTIEESARWGVNASTDSRNTSVRCDVYNNDGLDYTPISGTFTKGETITATSGGTANIIRVLDDDNRMVLSNIVGTIAVADTITGGTSGATATVGAKYFGSYSYSSTSTGEVINRASHALYGDYSIKLLSNTAGTSKLNFFEEGAADINVQVADAGNAISVRDSSDVEHIKVDVGNNIFDLLSGVYVRFNTGANICGVYYGTGSPEGVVTANIGSTYHRFDGAAGTSFYVKESGNATNTGWVGK